MDCAKKMLAFVFVILTVVTAIVNGAVLGNNPGDNTVNDNRTIFTGYSTSDFLYMVAGLTGIVVVGLVILAISRTCTGKKH